MNQMTTMMMMTMTLTILLMMMMMVIPWKDILVNFDANPI
jgi:hypothetical protein